jgi:chemotaxis-related protein WspD
MIDDCWKRIGVRGDGSCPELEKYAHCRNCDVYARAASELLRAAPSDASVADRTSQFAQPKAVEDAGLESVLIFRIDSEWLSLPTPVVDEVATPAPVHSLPHVRSAAVLGLTNVRGELLISVSLGEILGLTPSADSNSTGASFSRRLVLRRDAIRVVCPVDEVFGICRFRPGALRDVPATLGRSSRRYSTKLLPWNGHSVGVLDDQLLFYSVKRSIA